MKTVLAALAAAVLFAAPALASEPVFALRGVAEAGSSLTVARDAKPASGTAAAIRKVRVVLASPYGS